MARPEYLPAGQTKDANKSISDQGFAHILWMLRDHPHPPSFWRAVPADVVDAIFAGTSGNHRMANLFRAEQRQPITRDVVEAVAQQHDFMRRIRSVNGRGTRDILACEGILLLSWPYDAPLIGALDLDACSGSEFVSYRAQSRAEVDLAAAHGVALGWSPKG